MSVQEATRLPVPQILFHNNETVRHSDYIAKDKAHLNGRFQALPKSDRIATNRPHRKRHEHELWALRAHPHRLREVEVSSLAARIRIHRSPSPLCRKTLIMSLWLDRITRRKVQLIQTASFAFVFQARKHFPLPVLTREREAQGQNGSPRGAPFFAFARAENRPPSLHSNAAIQHGDRSREE